MAALETAVGPDKGRHHDHKVDPGNRWIWSSVWLELPMNNLIPGELHLIIIAKSSDPDNAFQTSSDFSLNPKQFHLRKLSTGQTEIITVTWNSTVTIPRRLNFTPTVFSRCRPYSLNGEDSGLEIFKYLSVPEGVWNSNLMLTAQYAKNTDCSAFSLIKSVGPSHENQSMIFVSYDIM